tara:strand:+ start:18109 stop:18819 length:711 start_codon:yes stop_codon:yes gene_type:complete
MAGHWYDKDGNPQYTIIGVNGKERDTDLRDARKLGLVPSVTTILKVAAAPALDIWKQQQLLKAVAEVPRLDEEPEKEWFSRIIKTSKEAGDKHMDRGTSMHNEIEDYFNKRQREYPDFAKETYFAVVKEFGSQNWITEKSFAYDGFGGKVDLHCEDIVIDFKTKEVVDEKTVCYDEQLMQLAAYRIGLELPDALCANVFVDLQGNVKIIKHDESDIQKAWLMFSHLLAFYRVKNGI